MRWPWSRKEPAVPTDRDSEAKRAQERARLSHREAIIDLVEMRARMERSKREREVNNFAGEIWQAMKRKPS